MAIVLNEISYKSVLDNISLTFEDGKITGIISSFDKEREVLGKIIMGIINDYNGKITSDYKGDNVSYNYLNPDDMLIGKTVREELSLSLERYNYKKETINKKCEDVLKIVKLSLNILDREVSKLSFGEKKLITISSSLITNPKVIILDDPYRYLDDVNRNNLQKVLKKIAKRYNKIIIVMSRDISSIYNLCDNFVLLGNEKITNNIKAKDLLNNEEVSLDITKFINLAKVKKNITLEKTTDIKELMKDIYRNVK